MDHGLEVAPGVHIRETDLRFAYSRSSGPGGQNVNKLNTKAELWLRPDSLTGLRDDARARLFALAGKRMTIEGELHLVAETARTQERNRSAVLEKLRELIIQAQHTPKKRRRTRPSAASRQRRLDSKRHRSETKAARRSHNV